MLSFQFTNLEANDIKDPNPKMPIYYKGSYGKFIRSDIYLILIIPNVNFMLLCFVVHIGTKLFHKILLY